MNENTKIADLLKELKDMFIFIHDLIDESKLELDDQYKRINYTYFKLFCCHFESFFILTTNNHFSSAILLMRTMLELFVKSFYLEFIEKNNGATIEDFLAGNKNFPSFFDMSKRLEDNDFGNFRGSFKQFTKSELASYEKFSLFSHGRGEVLKAFYKNNKISYTTEQISDVLLTAKGLFEQLSLLLFFTQEMIQEMDFVLRKIKA